MSPGSVKPGKRRERDVRRAAEARLEHAAAPHGDVRASAHVVDPSRLEVAADAPGLDVDDAARAEGDRVLRDARRGDRLVQADRRSHGLRELGVPEQVVLRKRLLDEQQVELVESGEVRGVVAGVGGVRVDLERDVAELLAHRAHGLDVVAGLDLQLDAAVALGEVALDRPQEIATVVVDPDRDAAVDLGARRAEELAERRAAARSSASRIAISTAAFAIGWPRTGAGSPRRRRPRRSPRARRGEGGDGARMTSCAPSTYSDE